MKTLIKIWLKNHNSFILILYHQKNNELELYSSCEICLPANTFIDNGNGYHTNKLKFLTKFILDINNFYASCFMLPALEINNPALRKMARMLSIVICLCNTVISLVICNTNGYMNSQKRNKTLKFVMPTFVCNKALTNNTIANILFYIWAPSTHFYFCFDFVY